MRENDVVIPTYGNRLRVMRIIARMNLGGPAIQVSGLMRGIDEHKFDQRLFTGYCDANESDYLETVATNIKATRIDGSGRRITFGGDFNALFALVKGICKFKPDIVNTYTAKAGFIGRIASILSLSLSINSNAHILWPFTLWLFWKI